MMKRSLICLMVFGIIQMLSTALAAPTIVGSLPSGVSTPATFSDNFTTLSLHNAWQSGDNWQLIAPDTPNGRGGPSMGENGDMWWVNPFNASTPISGIYGTDANGMKFGLLQTPSAYQNYINTQGGKNLPYVGGLLNSSKTSYQKYGYWSVTVAVPAISGLTFQMDTENVQLTGQFPPEIDLRINTNSAGTKTVLFEVALSPGYTTYTRTDIDITAYHTYGWKWASDFITFYIDGVQAFQTATPVNKNYTSNPMFMFLLTGANYIGNGDPATSSLPAYVSVSNVSVYNLGASTACDTSTESPDQTVVTDSVAKITDGSCNVWTITNGAQVAFNGAAVTGTANVAELAYVSHHVWQKNTAGNWYEFANDGSTTTISGPTTTSPLNGTLSTGLIAWSDVVAMCNTVGSAIYAANPSLMIGCPGIVNNSGTTLASGATKPSDCTNVSDLSGMPTTSASSTSLPATQVYYAADFYPQSVNGTGCIDSGATLAADVNAYWGSLITNNQSAVMANVGCSCDGSNGAQDADNKYGSDFILNYLNGKLSGGPTFTTTQQPISSTWDGVFTQ